MGDIRERLRANIEKVIDASKYSRTEIAEYLDVTPASITNWVKGRNSPDLEKLLKFCDLFGLSLNDIYASDTVKDERDTERERLLYLYDKLNFTGKMKLVDLADDLFHSGKYGPLTPKR